MPIKAGTCGGYIAAMQRLLSAIGFTASLCLVACSGGASHDAPRQAASSSPSNATVDTAFTGADSGRFCALISSFDADSSRIAPALNDPLALRDLFRRSEASVKQAAAVAPGEIKADVGALSKVYSDFLAALETVDFNLAKLPPSVVSTLSAPDTQRASARVSAYTANVCKITG